MIDEELYQQAADELNTDRRRPHIWARACALASDDHDEARFLYTNLRVEELIAERENAPNTAKPAQSQSDNNDQTLALTPLTNPDSDTDQADSLLDDFSLGGSDDVPSSVSAPSGIDLTDASADRLELEAENPTPATQIPIAAQPLELDPDLMSDYVPEPEHTFDDTYTGEDMAEDDFAMELESFKAEESGAHTLLDIDDDTEDALDSTHLDLDSTARLELDDDVIAELVADQSVADIAVETAEFEEPEMADMTQANVDVLDAQTSELDAMLEDARYQPEAEAPAVDDMSWLENEPDELDNQSPANEQAHKPVIYQDDSYRDELNRQADELGFEDNGADYSQQIAEELSRDDTFPESYKHPEPSNPSSDEAAANSDSSSASNAVVATVAASAAAVSTAAVSTAAASTAAASAGVAAAPDISGPRNTDEISDNDQENSKFPLDLTRGRKGTQFSIYRRNNNAQAVKSGVSWSALFMTLPYLIYRQLFGTALAYVAVWIITVGGLIVSGLTWLDMVKVDATAAGTAAVDAAAVDAASAGATAMSTAVANALAVTPIIQACTIGFALLCFIALIYLPFRYANAWRGERLESRGFELVAIAKGRNPGSAIARARRHSALG